MSAPKTYADNVVAYAQAGWPAILPVPPLDKTPPPVGYTGAEGRDTDPATLAAWATHPVLSCYSVALRMPADVIGIDVDSYVKGNVAKRGAETFAACLERWGPLPATWTSTARDPGGPSRIYFFRVPPQRYATKLVGNGTGDVEVIQRHHRYAVVWPSEHKDAGSIYRWYDPAGVAVDAPPKPEELPELPPAWVAGLAEGAAAQSAASADPASGQALLDQLLEDYRPECADITSARLTALEEISKADAGSRHDTMTARIHHLVQLAASGHTGAGHAFLELRMRWEELTAGENRADELERMLHTSARKAVTVVGAHQVTRDPCLLIQGFTVPGPAPEDNRPPDPENPPLEGIDPGRWYSVREAIGTAAFDPNAGLDQSLAEAVLARMYPALRYAYDSGTWLLKVPERWEERKDLSSWAVAQLAPLMPVGDPTAEKGSAPHQRAANRTRLMSSPGAKAVAAKIDALMKGGTHPATVRLGALDSDPEILWAGGMAYSLRHSHTGPTFATIDPSTPHLHAAGVTPELRPTPLWDAFLAAVWPDPELRAWALRVLSIALTGHSDRALPVLLGETGRGKTQVVHLLMSLLGSYAHAANPKLLGAGTNEHDTIVYALKGRRLSFIDEAPSDRKAGQERLKQLTGGGELTARQMNRDPISFRPTHTLVLTANDEPVLIDPAVRARVRLIPCEGDPEGVRHTRAAIGNVSGAAWRAEAPGVLAKLMSEAAGWLSDPGTASLAAAPMSVRYLAEHIGAEQDPVAVWVAEETEPFEAGTASRELYQAFVASCRRNSMDRNLIPSETKWGRQMNRLGYVSWHTTNGKRRALRVQMPGWTTPQANPPADGLTLNPDGFMTGSRPNPSGVFSQVNPTNLLNPDGLTGSTDKSTHVHAPAHARESGSETPANPSSGDPSEAPETAPDLQERGESGPDGLEDTNPSAKPKTRKPPSEATLTKRAAATAAKRAAAIAEAAGPSVQLPALVTRDAAVHELTLEQADALLATITAVTGHGELTVDVEHSGFPLGHQHYVLRTIQLGDENLAVVLDAEDQAHTAVASRHLAAARVLHAHSATADLAPLAYAGLLDYEAALAKMVDTAVLAKLHDPASIDNSADLKGLAKAMLGKAALAPAADEARSTLFKAGKWLTDTEVTTAPERSGWGQVDHRTETMVRYDGADVLDCAAIARRLPALTPDLLYRERLAQTMTARVALTGVRINADQVGRLLPEHEAAFADYADRIRAYGIENPGSPAQVGAALTAMGAQLPRTGTGKPSASKSALEPLAGDRDAEPTSAVQHLAQLMLQWRHHDTALKLFLRPYDVLVRNGDGRARPTVYTLGADTGRMSCVRPNLQQLPREGGFRACITADPGFKLISVDFAQVELRVAAGLSRCPSLTAIVNDPSRDMHLEIARLVWGPNATKSHRYKAKRKVFGRIYGQGVGGMALTDGAGVDVAKRVIEAMDALTPGLTEWSRMVRSAVEAGRTTFQAYSGRVIHLPKGAPHAAPNYEIQGTARELLIDALIRWSQTPWGHYPLWPVHDEVVAMVPEDQADEATAVLRDCMTTTLYGVPIVAEADEPSFEWKDSA